VGFQKGIPLMDEQNITNHALEDMEDEIEDETEDESMDDEMEGMDLNELVEASLKGVQQGEVLQGMVMMITKEYVVIDVGYKSEGQIPIREFLDNEGNITVKVGDNVDVLLERLETEDGGILLSKEKAAEVKVWDDIRNAYNENKALKGKIIARVRGGYTVDIGVHAFLPGSQADLRPVRDMDSLVGKTFEFRVLKYNKRRGNVVVSRRTLLEERREGLRAETLKKIQEVDVLPGVVKNITDFGAFIDLGGLDGLLHITDMSWGKVKHPSEVLNIGDKIDVKILNFDPEKKRVSLGLKQLVPDPWLSATEKYAVGVRVHGKVVSLTEYGAFVELEPGIEGLIHLSEMSWTRKIRHPSQVLAVGDEVEAMVLDIKPDARRISLGLKQVEPNPWDAIGEKYPVDTVIEGKIKDVTDFGVFIGIDEGIDGLVHISDLSWSQRVKHPSELYKKGQEVQAKVIKIDRENERFSLSIKHVTPDPWEQAAQKYPINSRVTGTITNVTDFGVFVELEDGIEGLVHVSEISEEKIKTPVGMFNVGDTIETKVIDVNRKDHKISLSIKRLDEDADQVLVREYLSGGQTPFSSLGDLLKENLENKQKEEETEE
jgi:small subunit ribosomal protein S1